MSACHRTILRGMLQATRSSEQPLVFAAPGSGLSTLSALRAGVPFLMVLNAGLFRASGVSSRACFMPFGNANEQVERLLREQILPRCAQVERPVPIVAGVLASDPTCSLDERLDALESLNVAGVVNWPPVSMHHGTFLDQLRDRGFSESSERAMLSRAKERGLVTFAFAGSLQGARELMQTPVDALIINPGWTLSESLPMTRHDRVQHSIQHTNELIRAVRHMQSPEPTYLFYGGGILTAQDTLTLYQRTEVDGFGAGSALEYFPVNDLIQSLAREFMSVSKKKFLPGGAVEVMHPDFVAKSPSMHALYRTVQRLASFNVSVTIEGESGVGKEVVATLLHALGPRHGQPLITINCGAIPESLIESELFGYERGAFTGATERRLGKFELANKGTLFLDEVAELSLKAQAALLRTLQQREIVRLGGRNTIPVDVRIVSASNRNLEELVRQGLFRADLFYRLNMTALRVPPLRERMQDIDILAQHFLEQCRQRYECKAMAISKHFIAALKNHSWPGNVRELQHVLFEAAIMEDGPILMGYTFSPNGLSSLCGEHKSEKSGVISLRFQRAQEAVTLANGNKAKAALTLGISRKTLYKWLEPKV